MVKVWARSVLCSLIITRLIKGKLTAAPTGLFAHNCQRGGKVAPRKQNQSHISHLSRVPQNRMLKAVWGVFQELPFLSQGKLTNIPFSISLHWVWRFLQRQKWKGKLHIWHNGNNIDKHRLDEGEDAPAPFPWQLGWEHQLHRSVVNVCFGNVLEKTRQWWARREREKKDRRKESERETARCLASLPLLWELSGSERCLAAGVGLILMERWPKTQRTSSTENLGQTFKAT